jgi:hypothetical protein
MVISMSSAKFRSVNPQAGANWTGAFAPAKTQYLMQAEE